MMMIYDDGSVSGDEEIARKVDIGWPNDDKNGWQV